MGRTRVAFGIFSAMLLSAVLVALLDSQVVKAEPFIEGWSRVYGGAGFEHAYALVQTSDGGYALAGVSNSSGTGTAYFWLVKTDASGNMQWNKTYGGTNDIAYALVQTSDGGYALAGSTNSYYRVGDEDIWLVKTDASGNMIWNMTYGEPGDRAWALVQTSDGGYAIAGSSHDDAYLVKTDASGYMEWENTYGGPDREEARALVQTADGGYALAGGVGGFWLAKTTASGYMLWDQTYGGAGPAYALVQTADGGYAMGGYTRTVSSADDFWLVRTTASGYMMWNQSYGGALYDWAYAMVQTNDGGYTLAGQTPSGTGKMDLMLVKTDASGYMMWNTTFGGTDDRSMRGLWCRRLMGDTQ